MLYFHNKIMTWIEHISSVQNPAQTDVSAEWGGSWGWGTRKIHQTFTQFSIISLIQNSNWKYQSVPDFNLRSEV